MIFVTGGSGFLGSHLLKNLSEKNFEVRALRRKESTSINKSFSKVEWVEGDILDVDSLKSAMDGCSTVYHCAGHVSFLPSDREKLFKINTEGTANVVNTALKCHVNKLVHVSSIAALGRNAQEKIINENTVWEKSKLNSQYAVSKHYSEMEVWRGIAEGLTSVIVNPSVILGKGNWSKGTGKLFSSTWEGMKAFTTGTTGFVDVDDVANAMVMLMNKDIENERFILNSENWSYQKLFFSIADAMKKKRPSIKANNFLSDIAWRLEKIKSYFTNREPLITKETARIANATFFYDNSKIKNALDFEFTPLQTTVERTSLAFINEKLSRN